MAKPCPTETAVRARPGQMSRLLHLLPVLLLMAGALLISAVFIIHMIRMHDTGEDRLDAPEASQHVLPGLTLVNAQPPGSGLVVTSIQSGGGAARQGLAVGDDIVAIDGQPVHTLDQASRYLIGSSQRTVMVALVRKGQMRWVTLDRPGY